MPGQGPDPMHLGLAPWALDLDLAPMEPPHRTLVKGNTHTCSHVDNQAHTFFFCLVYFENLPN